MIDAFAHFYPPAFMERLFGLNVPLPVFVQRTPSFESESFRIEELERNEIETQVIALGTPAFDDLFESKQNAAASELARIGNDGIAEMAAHHPQRFIAAVTLPLLDPNALDESLKELERAVQELNVKAIQLYTRTANVGVDDARFDPLWEKIAGHDLTVLLHPTRGMDNPLAHDYLLWLTFGWPLDTSLVMLRLVYAGLFQRFPNLKILTHHLGAFIPFMAARVQGVNYTLERTGGIQLEKPLLDSLRLFYGDTAVNGYAPALEAGHKFFGAEHILFGTDYPYVPIAPQRNAVLNWELASQEKNKILEGNARRLFQA
jgi:predicted TIM-barrel fold metal-dependent hydrolase